MEKRKFEDWYDEIVESKFFDKYTIKNILKIAWVVGADSFSNSDEVLPFFLEEDEELVLSYEMQDPDYEKNHPEIFNVPFIKLEDRLSKEIVEELKNKIEEKRNTSDVV